MSPIPSRRRSARSASAAFRRRWRRGSSTACSALAACLALAACGGDGSEERLATDVGATLAAEAADVHERLDAGDAIGAHAEAQELHALAEDAIARGGVPRALAGELRAGAARLVQLTAAAIPPAEPPAPPPPPADEGDDEERKEPKEPKEPKKKDREGDGDGDGERGAGDDGDD